MLHCIDHVVIAVRDLAAATEHYAGLLGRPAAWRGSHPGAGTENTLFSLERGYLELLASAGDGPVGRTIADALEQRGEGVVALALGTHDADQCRIELMRRGVEAGVPTPGEGREATSGVERRWRTVHIPFASSRGLMLFAIEHESESELLTLTRAEAGELSGLDHAVVMSPDLEAAKRLYGERLGLRLALDRSFEKRGIRLLFFRLGGVTLEVGGRIEGDAQPELPDRFGGLAYRVADADAARARLVAAGFDVSEVSDGFKPGTRVCSVRDRTCGVPTLVIEPAR
jgi:catechol 2,3-dioxygenase-like lactoylglutathione lyase family enzyme